MRCESRHPPQLLAALAMLFGLARAATSQTVPSCTRADDIAIGAVSIVGTQRASAQYVPIDTLWIPSENRFGDAIFVRILPIATIVGAGDSIYLVATIQLMLRTRTTPGDAARDFVAFPTRIVRDTIVALSPGESATLGPFSTNHLIPWPGIAVEASANSLPVAVAAVAWILRTRRSTRSACTERLQNNSGRSRLVTLQYAY